MQTLTIENDRNVVHNIENYNRLRRQMLTKPKQNAKNNKQKESKTETTNKQQQ